MPQPKSWQRRNEVICPQNCWEAQMEGPSDCRRQGEGPTSRELGPWELAQGCLWTLDIWVPTFLPPPHRRADWRSILWKNWTGIMLEGVVGDRKQGAWMKAGTSMFVPCPVPLCQQPGPCSPNRDWKLLFSTNQTVLGKKMPPDTKICGSLSGKLGTCFPTLFEAHQRIHLHTYRVSNLLLVLCS